MILSEDKILVLDGAMGTMIQRFGLGEEDYHTGPFADCGKDLKGNNECLNLTRPEVIRSIHKEYIAAGADIIETNTFSANEISQAEYGCKEFATQMAREGARLAREAADEAQALAASIGLNRKVWVAGSMGPTSKSLSLSPDASDPAFRPYTFDQMKEAYRRQAEALLEGGADLLLIETCFDALNVKAALAGIMEYRQVPVIISVSVGDRSGRTLTGQTLEAFHASVQHYPLLAFGLNCSLGASELMPLVEEVGSWCSCGVSCYPNAGLPNEMGGYDQSPEEMAAQVKAMASKGLVNIVGGCCGTTPEHIKAIAMAVRGIKPRPIAKPATNTAPGVAERASRAARPLKVSGLEAVTVDVQRCNFINIGERTNVAGSRKFARLISEGSYDEAMQIAAKQIEDGAAIIDINMDDAMLDSTKEMERFVRYISNDPAVAKAALMIDSSHWETILAGLKNAQGKCIVNSISLKEGPEAFVEKAKVIKSFGAAMVVMAFDEQGQATTYDRKIEICERAYRHLTEEAGVNPEDIIFDVNILSIGTGIEEHARYAVDFIEAVRWIKTNLPGALTSGGVSNLSFAFRGNNPVREAMHSAFLYHAIKAGMDMAIVNPSMLQIYDEIEPELLKCVEDVIFDTDPQATERLIEKATRMKMADQVGHDGGHGQSGNDTTHYVIPGNSNVIPGSTGNLTTAIRLQTALMKGRTDTLEADIMEALKEYGSATSIIEGPLMEGMEAVGKMFGEGKMFLPQVVKSAKVMRDAVTILEPYINRPSTHHTCTCQDHCHEHEHEHVHCHEHDHSGRPKIVLATVKGDVHDIGKNITGIVLTCNGFDIHDLGVMVDKETILTEAEKIGADIIAVSGLITPSLYQMEELCRDMQARGMAIPLFVGGATTSALHTAVKLAPLYGHVFHGADASAAAVLAKKCMMDREAFEREQHEEQDRLRALYEGKGEEISPLASLGRNDSGKTGRNDSEQTGRNDSENDTTIQGRKHHTDQDIKHSVISSEAEGRVEKSIPLPADIPAMEIDPTEVLPYFDWRMFYAIWGVKYGSASPEAMELMQLRQDAEDELAVGNFRIMLSAKFFMGASEDGYIYGDGSFRIPFMRQETGLKQSLCDFVPERSSGRRAPWGMFAISVNTTTKQHDEGCCCPACSNKYEDLVAKTVRMTLAEAASKWLDEKILRYAQEDRRVPGQVVDDDTDRIKVIKPAAGYSSCPDHTLKGDILKLLPDVHKLGIRLTESYAMVPEASICGFIFMHPQAKYPEIRRISQEQYDRYASRRKMSEETARRFLGHLL